MTNELIFSTIRKIVTEMWLVVSPRSYAVRYPPRSYAVRYPLRSYAVRYPPQSYAVRYLPRVHQQCLVKSPLLLCIAAIVRCLLPAASASTVHSEIPVTSFYHRDRTLSVTHRECVSYHQGSYLRGRTSYIMEQRQKLEKGKIKTNFLYNYSKTTSRQNFITSRNQMND